RKPAGRNGRWCTTRGGGPRMTRDELAARLLHTFLEELDEQVRVLNAELLALEREGASAQRLGAVFRVAHTLKGAARATRLTPIEELCHAMEGPLAGAQSGARGLREEDFQLLFEAADALSSAGDRLRRSEPLDSAALRTLARRFSASSGRYGSAHLTTPGFGGAPVRDSRQRPATAKTGAGAGRSGSQPRDRSNAGDGFGDSDESDRSAESG